MTMCLYSVRDDKADEFGPIFEAKNDEVAKRSFKQLLESQPISPLEFALYRVGFFDHEKFEGVSPINDDVCGLVCIGSELFKEDFE